MLGEISIAQDILWRFSEMKTRGWKVLSKARYTILTEQSLEAGVWEA